MKSNIHSREEVSVQKDSPSPSQLSQEEIFKVVEAKRNRLVALLEDLIRIPTVVPPGNNYEKIVQYLEPIFQSIGYNTKQVIVPEEEIEKIPYPLEGPRVNLVATRDYEREEPVTIYAHTDVVPIEESWTKEPFNPIVENGKLYGRGAIDMKCGIAGMIVALEVLHELGIDPHFNIICTLCTDEEIGVYPGIYHLAKEGYVQGHVINTELGAQMPFLIAGVAGNVDVKIRTKGRSCHSGMNFLGINAIEAMIPILNELYALKKEVEKRESTIPVIPLLRSLGAPSDKVTPMFNIDIIHGGTKSNIVPAECEVIINRRYIPEESYEQVVQEIEAAVERGKAKSKALEVEITTIHSTPPFKADITSTYAKKMQQALQAVHGFQDTEFIVGGAAVSTDMGFITQACGIDKILGIGAATLDNTSAHKPDEWVRIDDLMNMTKQLIHYLAL
ncbi:MAG: M20 family metallopeptidase [Candidatus Hermodarchaeia archaeon]|jgi:succinyl-diaminopimelate desuccinylase